MNSKKAEGDAAESPPQPPAIINVHLEEPQKDPIEEKRLAEERRAERRRIRELEDKEETDKQAFQQIINMQNNQIQQLSELAQITNKLSEEQVRGSMAQAADRVALTHQAYINALVRGIGEKSVVYNMAPPIENHLHLSTEGDPKILQQQQEWGGDEGGGQDGAAESSGRTSESPLPAPAARTQPAVKPCGMNFADAAAASSIRQSEPMDAAADSDQADSEIPETMSTDDLPDYNSAPVSYNRSPAIVSNMEEEASDANMGNSLYQPFGNELPPYVAEGLMPGNPGDFFGGPGQFGGSPTDAGVAGIPAFD
eukprot:GILK01002297.1.p1 GENE.GILK01002297.1~~GILK01002297.1.p1  ORF type:complete len:311 (+),score=42.96 GILK01002297.1:242-1174(+)